MNRIEFMTELAALLQDVPVEERRDAMQFYNDYFDDAGDEQQVIAELESPAKVAATIKANLEGSSKEHGEFTEKGYTDSRFEQKEMPAGRESQEKEYRYDSHRDEGDSGYQDYGFQKNEEEPPRTNHILKICLVILLVLVGAPIIIPVTASVLVAVVAGGVGMFAVFFALVFASAAVAFAGVCVFIAGLVSLIPEIAVGLALVGTGLILTVVGAVATVASVRLCVIVLPGIFRGFVWLCRQPFQRRAVA